MSGQIECKCFERRLASADIESCAAEVHGVLRNFTEITRLDPDRLSEGDALIEVPEFLWVEAMLVHSELVFDPVCSQGR